jgi:DNA-binding MarR family transcriptional regulator
MTGSLEPGVRNCGDHEKIRNMTLSEPPALAGKTAGLRAEEPLPPPLTRPQRRILHLLSGGDLIWEIAGEPRYRTVYHEKRGRDQRIPAAVVAFLEQQGWIQRRPNPQPDRLDSWELTAQGNALLGSER